MPTADPWDTAATDAPQLPAAAARVPARTPTRTPVPSPDTAAPTEPAEQDWPTPTPLLRYPDPLPVDALGAVLGPMVAAVSHTYQVPSDVAVTMALPLITTAAAGRWSVHVRPGWKENLALAALTVLGSSGGKSPVLSRLRRPLDDLETEARAAAVERYAREKALHEELKDRVEKYRADLKNTPAHNLLPGSTQAADHEAKRELYLKAASAYEAHEITAPPRWTCDDITPEALAKVMYEQGGAIGIVSDEAGIFGTLGGRYAQGQSNLDVVLKGISGTRIQIDRKSQTGPPIIIDRPTLSISVAVQPGLLRRLGDKPEFRESGFLGRFLPVMPESMMGRRLMRTDDVPEAVEELYAGCLEELAKLAQELRDRGQRRDLWLDPEAEAAVDEFRERMEPQFLEGGQLELLSDFGGKLAGTAVRIAAALTLLENAEAEIVDGARMRDALRLAAGYIDHAQVSFGALSGGDPSTPHARVVAWLAAQHKDVVSHREVHQAFKKRPWGRTSKDMDDLMSDLERAGYVRRDKRVPEGERGGRPAVVWVVNPSVLKTPDSWRFPGLLDVDPDVA